MAAEPQDAAAVGRVIDKTIERLPAERRLFPDLYADQVAQRLLDSDDPDVQAALLRAVRPALARLIRSTVTSRHAWESVLPTCGRKGCGSLAGHNAPVEAWDFALERVADELDRQILTLGETDDEDE